MSSNMDIEWFRKESVMFIREGETLELAIFREIDYVERCTGRKVKTFAVDQRDKHWAYVIWEFH